jgi:hypothetical protein
MIEQYLLNNNKTATVAFHQKICQKKQPPTHICGSLLALSLFIYLRITSLSCLNLVLTAIIDFVQ